MEGSRALNQNSELVVVKWREVHLKLQHDLQKKQPNHLELQD